MNFKKALLVIMMGLCLNTSASYAQLPHPSSHIDCAKKEALIKTAKDVAMTFGSAYVPYFKDAVVSEAKVFQKEHYGDSFSKIRKQIGREYYTITFTYDSTSVRFAFDFAAKVNIWKDTGAPLDVIFGNGMGRNFFSKVSNSKRSVLPKRGRKRQSN